MPKTSVIVCTYNGQSYLREQLESLIKQDALPDEIIIIDDASTDDSWKIICEFKKANTDVCIRTFINHENIGFVDNFSKAALLATHELIFFCDQDDVWSEIKISSITQLFMNDPLLTCVHTNAEVVNERLESSNQDLFKALKITKHEMGAMQAGNYFEVLVRRNVVTGATMVIRKDLLIKSLPIPPGWIHDEWISIFNSTVGKVALHNSKLIKYRIHDKNTLGLGSGNSILKNLLVRDSAESFYADRISKLTQLRGIEIFSTEQGQYLDSYIAHLRFRILVTTLPLPKRIGLITKKILDGSYKTFGRGIFSAARDFFS